MDQRHIFYLKAEIENLIENPIENLIDRNLCFKA